MDVRLSLAALTVELSPEEGATIACFDSVELPLGNALLKDPVTPLEPLRKEPAEERTLVKANIVYIWLW